MLPVKLQGNRVHVGGRFSVSFQRTDRLGPGWLARRPISRGQLPARLVGSLPPEFGAHCHDGVCLVVPCDQAEAVWLGFAGEDARRVALKIRQGDLNAVTGGDWDEALHQPQDYLVPPDQLSWYGVASAEGYVHQFSGDSVELVVYEPGHPVDHVPHPPNWNKAFYGAGDVSQARPEEMSFRVVPDPHGITFWSSEPSGRVQVYFVDSEVWRSLTGEDPPERVSGYGGSLLP